MQNPAQHAQTMVEMIVQILRTKPIAGSTRSQLESALESAVALHATITRIHHDVIDLALGTPVVDHSAARAAWEALAPGPYGPGSPAVGELVEVSAALGGLQRAGVRVRGVRRFGPADLAVARALGDLFRDGPEVLDALKHTADRGLGATRFRRADVDAALAFFRALTAAGEIAGHELEIYRYSEEAWRPANLHGLRAVRNPGQAVRVKHTPLSGYRRTFVTGDWLTAFAADVLADHLDLNRIEHELYTMVAYEAPRDILDDRSDLDVLVCARDRFLLVECKAGRLDTNGGHEGLSALVTRFAALERVLRTAGRFEGSVDPLLVFNPHLVDRALVEERLAGTGVRAVSPDALRSVVMELLR